MRGIEGMQQAAVEAEQAADIARPYACHGQDRPKSSHPAGTAPFPAGAPTGKGAVPTGGCQGVSEMSSLFTLMRVVSYSQTAQNLPGAYSSAMG